MSINDKFPVDSEKLHWCQREMKYAKANKKVRRQSGQGIKNIAMPGTLRHKWGRNSKEVLNLSRCFKIL